MIGLRKLGAGLKANTRIKPELMRGVAQRQGGFGIAMKYNGKGMAHGLNRVSHGLKAVAGLRKRYAGKNAPLRKSVFTKGVAMHHYGQVRWAQRGRQEGAARFPHKGRTWRQRRDAHGRFA